MPRRRWAQDEGGAGVLPGPGAGGGSATRTVAITLAVWALVWPLVVALLTLHATAQRPGSVLSALERANVYDRLYTQVLTDPQIVDVTQQLMARLPVDRTVVTDNLRVVIPPSTVRGIAERLAEQVAGYCAGRQDSLDLHVDLQPVFENIARLVSLYLVGRLSDAHTYQARDVSTLVHTLLEVAAQISRGHPPTSVPTLALSENQVQTVADAVLTMLASSQRSTVLRDQIVVLLRQGDLPGTLALIGPLIFHGAADAVADLQRRLDGNRLDLGAPFAATADSPAARGVEVLHVLGDVGVLSLAAVAIAIMLTTLGLVTRGMRRRGRRILPVTLAALGAAGLAGLLVGLVVHLEVDRSLRRSAADVRSLPPGVRQLVDDVTQGLVGQLMGGWWRLSAAPLVLAVVILTGRVLLGPLLADGVVRPRAARGGWATTGWVFVTAAAVSLTTWLLVPVATNAGTLVCNGSGRLCARRYDQVTYAATHNAMAASDSDFLGPDQDLDMIGQLDGGVRALLIDIHHWTTPTQVASFLSGLPADQRAAVGPYLRAPVSARDGLWLCHNVCQLGALELTGQLRRLRSWLDANPTEIITLIVQDEAPADEIMAAFRDAGLERHLLVPPADPGDEWPRLGDMVRKERRLVVLAERGDKPGTWYRRFFSYASDTPFRVTTPDGFTCDPDRGNVSAPMLLINHWVNRATGSHYDATIVNRRSSLLAHVKLCATARVRRPTFLAVDFAGIGDLVDTVAEINAGTVPGLPLP